MLGTFYGYHGILDDVNHSNFTYMDYLEFYYNYYYHFLPSSVTSNPPSDTSSLIAHCSSTSDAPVMHGIPPDIRTFKGVRDMKHKGSVSDGLKRSSSLSDLPESEDSKPKSLYETLLSDSKKRPLSRYERFAHLPSSKPIFDYNASDLDEHDKPRTRRSRSVTRKETDWDNTFPRSSKATSRTSFTSDRNLPPSRAIRLGSWNPGEKTGARTSPLTIRNATDEHKINTSDSSPARTESESFYPVRKRYESEYSQYTKKGWLVRLKDKVNGNRENIKDIGQENWQKHWFVLNGTQLRYYKDSRAEEAGHSDGNVDLRDCTHLYEKEVGRNYGFEIKSLKGTTTLSAMTTGIRNNWLTLMRKAMHHAGVAPETQRLDSPNSKKSLKFGLDYNQKQAPSGRQLPDLPKDEQLDEVEKNVRRIHQRSLTDFINKPKFYEVGNNVDVDNKRNRTDSERSTSSSPCTPRGERNGKSSSENNSSPCGGKMISKKSKAPSAKIKERSRAKSPRVKSPPLRTISNGETHSSKRLGGGSGSSSPSNSTPGTPTKSKYEQGDKMDMGEEDKAEKKSLAKSTSSGAISAGDTALVDLLETEVDSLKTQLEQSQNRNSKLQHQISELRSKTHQRQASRDSVVGSPSTPSRKHSQVQTYLDDSDTGESIDVLQAKLVDHQRQATMIKAQMSRLSEQVAATEQTATRHADEAKNYRRQLDACAQRLVSAERQIDQFRSDLRKEQDKNAEKDMKLKQLERDFFEKDDFLRRKSVELDETKNRVKSLQTKLLDVDELEGQLQDSMLEARAVTDELSQCQIKIRSKEQALRIQQERFQSALKENDQLRERLQTLEAELEAPKQKKANESPMDRSDVLLQEKNKEIADLQNRLEDTENTLRESNRNCSVLRSQLEHELEEGMKIRQELATSEEKLREANQEIEAVARHDDDASKVEFRKYESEMAELERENEKVMEMINAKNEELMETVKEKETLAKQLSNMKSSVEINSRMETRYKEAISELQRVEEEKRKLREDFETSMTRKDNELREARRNIENLKEVNKESEGSDADDPAESRRKYERAISEIKRLRKRCNETQDSLDKIEIAYAGIKQQLESVDEDYQEQLRLMCARVEDLTNKLTVTERKKRRESLVIDLQILSDIDKQVQVLEETFSINAYEQEEEEKEKSEEMSLPINLGPPPQVAVIAPDGSQGIDNSPRINDKEHDTEIDDLISDTCSTTSESSSTDQLQVLHNRLVRVLESISTEDKTSNLEATEKQYRDARKKLRLSLDMIDSTRKKLKDLVSALQSLDFSRASENTLENVVHGLKDALLVTDSVEYDSIYNKESKIDKMDDHGTKTLKLNALAEKLAIEAIVVGEMAYVVRSQTNKQMTERDMYLSEMRDAHSQILELECKLEEMQVEKNQIDKAKNDSLSTYAQLLAEKMVLQAELYLSMQKTEVPKTKIESDALGNVLASEAVSRCSQTDIEGLCPVARSALVQAELSAAVSHLRRGLCTCSNDRERIDLVESELKLAKERLEEREKALEQAVTKYLNENVAKVAKVSKENKVQAVLQRKASETSLSLPENEEKAKHVNEALAEEVQQTMQHFKSFFDVQTIEEADDTLLEELADIVTKKAVISGQLAYMHEHFEKRVLLHMFNRTDSGLPSSPPDVYKAHIDSLVADSLQQDAAMKDSMANYLKHFGADGMEMSCSLTSRLAQLAADLGKVEDSLQKRCRPASGNDLADIVAREAVFHAQLAYVAYTLKYEHAAKLEELKAKYTDRKEVETKREVEYRQDDRQQLYSEIENMEKELHRAHLALEQIRQDKENQLAVLHARVAQMEAEDAICKAHLEKLQNERDSDIEHLRNRVEKLQLALEEKSSRYQIEFSSLQAESDLLLQNERDRYEKQIDEERQKFQVELERLMGSRREDSAVQARIHQLESELQDAYDSNKRRLAVEKATHTRLMNKAKEEWQSMSILMRNSPEDETKVVSKYKQEMERMKELYDRGLVCIERTNEQIINEMKVTHERELQKLKLEREEELKEEVRATQTDGGLVTALDSLRKAQREELEMERKKYADLERKVLSSEEIQSLQRQHDEDMELMQKEIKCVGDKLSLSNLEKAQMEERIEKQAKLVTELKEKVEELLERNDELNLKLEHDIEVLSKKVTTASSDCQLHSLDLKLKETDIERIKDEKRSLHIRLRQALHDKEEATADSESLQAQHSLIVRQLQSEKDELSERLRRKESGSTRRRKSLIAEIEALQNMNRESWDPRRAFSISEEESNVNSTAFHPTDKLKWRHDKSHSIDEYLRISDV
ncbi:DgyrCDS12407 [Dimorphilus gyrociliatus]|uniref:DgyrCDS12407 n=1 Tax=Dimorphilus gyrociliatus TaxID=2664684 RepID=A0A7I8W8K1_9ANNE|nr:DgyrCDS12407 [Dimorphilus gyrociliatus]